MGHRSNGWIRLKRSNWLASTLMVILGTLKKDHLTQDEFLFDRMYRINRILNGGSAAKVGFADFNPVYLVHPVKKVPSSGLR